MKYYHNWQNLGAEIAIRAIKDYEYALKCHHEDDIKALEKWFNGEWCNIISPIDGETIIEYVRRKTNQ